MGFRGLDTKSSPPNLDDSRAVDLLNVKLSSALDLRKRSGFSVINATLDDFTFSSPAITGIFDSEYSNGASHTLAFVGSKLKYNNSGTWSDVSGTATITSDKNAQFQCIMALDSAICTNDTDPIIKVNSSPTKSVLNVSALTDTLTKAKAIAWFRNYFIMGNTVENGVSRPTRFRFSEVGTVESYDDDDFVDISTFAGDQIVGFAELYGDLYIFLTKSIWKASLVGGDDIFIFTKVIDGIGAISRDSIQVVQLSDSRSAAIFLDDHKKILLFNGIAVTDLGVRIQPTLDDLNESRLQYAVSTFDGKDYYLAASSSAQTENDIVFDLQAEIFEWTKFDHINANAMAQIKESTSTIKTYFGNYDSFVYWMDDPDNINDVAGAVGIVDSVSTVSTTTETGAQVIYDSDLADGIYTGAIVRITSGTGAGAENVILTMTGLTGLVVVNAFSETPDSTSTFSIGDVNAYYNGKHYDFGDASRTKTMLGMIFWGREQSDSVVTVSHAIDFGTNVNSESVSLSPSSTSLWDSALWDDGTWGTTGNKIYTVKFSGFGQFLQPKFSNDAIDETFHLYGFNLLGLSDDTRQ